MMQEITTETIAGHCDLIAGDYVEVGDWTWDDWARAEDRVPMLRLLTYSVYTDIGKRNDSAVLKRDAVAKLHAILGAWLEKYPADK
jgi:hypothetical protein